MRAITLKEVTQSDFYFKKSHIGIFQHHESEGSYHAYHICNCQSTFRTHFIQSLSSTHFQRVCRFSIAVDSHGERKKKNLKSKNRTHDICIYF